MRIVHVAPTPFGSGGIIGGGERYPLELARALAAHTECELITFGKVARTVEESSGLTIRTLRAISHAYAHPAQPLAPGLPGALRGASVIHTHHMRSLPSKLALITGRLRHTPVVVTDHGLQGSDWRGWLPELFDHILAVSAYSASELQSPPHRTHIIYGGVNPERFHPDPVVRRRGVLFVGRITPHKGVDRLITALPNGATLRIVGSGGHDPHPPERDYSRLLRQLARGRDVQFLGAVAENQLPYLYRSSEVLVLPSVHRTCYGRSIRVSELLGLVVLEAMASGTPVICSRVGGLPEIVEDGITGYLVEPGNVSELRERLAELLTDKARARRIGERAREAVLQRFTWQACAERCLQVYEQLIRRHSQDTPAASQ